MSVALELNGVEVRRGGRAVVSVGSLAVGAGESLAIVGPNGAGKSTLLSVLAGLVRPDRGEATIGGAPARTLASRRRVALVPQDSPMLAGSVLHNVALPLALRGVPRHERDARARTILDAMGLGSLAPRDGRALSGGEARRVALARALAARPDALLLDEPFAGVDEPARDALLADIRAQVRESRTTLVLVTQVREEALRAGTRMAILVGGAVAQQGSPEELFSRPASPDVARFLGLENVLRGRVVSCAEGVAEVEAGGRRLVGAASGALAAGADVWVIVSPDHVELRAEDGVLSTSVRNVLSARVVSLEPREGRVHVRLDAGVPLVAAVTRAAV
ncbi:MAG TPA: ABC transporter ATP-binding protein, partial [bacterium]|nr:ABC transporter ATP-binding protein [bacterium]